MTIEQNEQNEDLEFNRGHKPGKGLKNFVAKALVFAALANPIIGLAEENSDEQVPSDAENVSTGKMVSMEGSVIKLSEREKNMMMIGDLTSDLNVNISSIPVKLIDRLMEESTQGKLTTYYKELKDYGCNNPNRLEKSAKWLNTVDNDNTGPFSLSGEKSPKHEQVGDYIVRSQVLGYAKTGEFLNVYHDENGNSKFLLANMDEDDTKEFSQAVSFLKENGADNVIAVLEENGVNTVLLHKYDENGYSFSDEGVINLHGDKFGKITSQEISKALMEQGVAIRLVQLSYGSGLTVFSSDIRVLAPMLAGDNWEHLYKKTGQSNVDLLVLATEAREKASINLETLVLRDQGSHVENLYKLITQKNLVRVMGAGSWELVGLVKK